MSSSEISIDSMRRIDRFVGVPLCALATVLLKIWWRVRPAWPQPVRRILFIELSEMGSVILADPAIRKAHDRTGAEIYFAIFAKNAHSLEFTESIAPRNVFIIETNSMWSLVVDTLAFLIWTRRNEIDTVVDLELFSRFTGLLTGLSGANRRIGFHRFYGEGLYRGDMLTHRVAYNPHIHIAKNFIALVDSLLSAVPTVPYSKTVIDDQQLIVPVRSLNASACDKVKAQIKALVSRRNAPRLRLLMVCPSVSEKIPQRRWMPERYLELIQQILATHDDVLVLIMGASSERAEAEELAAQCASDRCITLAGCTTITDLRALYSLAVAMVTNDSGPAHFAAASGLPTIVLFGPETPNLYRPLGNAIVIYAGLACSPCVSANNHRKSACDDNVCMRAISVEQVFKVVNTVLTANSRVCLI